MLQLLPQKIGEATQFLSKFVNDILVVIWLEAKKEETKEKTVMFFLHKAVKETLSPVQNQKITKASRCPPVIRTENDTLHGNTLLENGIQQTKRAPHRKTAAGCPIIYASVIRDG